MSDQQKSIGTVTAVDGGSVKFMGTTSTIRGMIVVIETGQSRVIGRVESVTALAESAANPEYPILASVDFLGEFTGDDPVLQGGIATYPEIGNAVLAASEETLSSVYAPPVLPGVPVGHVPGRKDLPASLLVNRLLGKHFGVFGATGTGKSCAVSGIVNRILDHHAHGHVIIFDPNSEYRTAFGDRAVVLDAKSLRLPYWMLNFEELCQVMIRAETGQVETQINILRETVLAARRDAAHEVAATGMVTVDTPIPYRLSRLRNILETRMSALEKHDPAALPYQKLIWALDGMLADKNYFFMFSNFLLRDCLAEVVAQILRVPVDGRPVTVVDVSTLPEPAVQVTISAISRLILDFALCNTGDPTVPLLLICEDAHHFAPHGGESQFFAATKHTFLRLAREGRKNGIALGLVSQRPSELSANLLSQCGTIFAFRMSNEDDARVLAGAMPQSSQALSGALSVLSNRQAVAVGDGVLVPMVMRFADLAKEETPGSLAVPFATGWDEDVGDFHVVERVVARWRFME